MPIVMVTLEYNQLAESFFNDVSKKHCSVSSHWVDARKGIES